MLEFFDGWLPGEFIALAGVLMGGIVLIVLIGVWGSVRGTQIEAETQRHRAELVRDLLERGVPVDQVNQVLDKQNVKSSPSTDECMAAVAGGLTGCDTPAEQFEEVLGLLRDADLETQQSAKRMIEEMEDYDEVTPEKMVAAIRGLCRDRAKDLPFAEPAMEQV